MCRIFSYCRVSTSEQSTDNQILAIQQKGIVIEPHRVVTETISGGVPAMERPEFSNLVNNKLETGDQLVVLKLDRLGRDMIDIVSTIKMLQGKKISVRSLDLDGVDLTSAAGEFQLKVLAAVADFERNRIIERTREGLLKARSEGRIGGRPKATSHDEVQRLKAEGMSQSNVAKHLSVSISTIKRCWN
ncbi:recombinase family protein [Serratia fonticola]|uniref:recombinase family protein n=1 Tax=Serratia fonticola TaxID=47917 RepID=UPI003AF33B68